MPDYKEKTNHGDALMPVRYYHCSVPNSYRNLSLHWHEEMEITLITPIAMDEGLRFAIREGGRTVASGVVHNIIE